MSDKKILGEIGEKIAQEYLIKKNYLLVELNWRYKKAEVDIIVQKEQVLAAVEVKTRSTSYFGNPEEFVNPKKIKLLISAMDHYVVEDNLDVEVRFDIIAIIHQNKHTKIEHLKDAFLYF